MKSEGDDAAIYAPKSTDQTEVADATKTRAASRTVPPGTMIVAGTFLVTFRHQRYDRH